MIIAIEKLIKQEHPKITKNTTNTEFKLKMYMAEYETVPYLSDQPEQILALDCEGVT